MLRHWPIGHCSVHYAIDIDEPLAISCQILITPLRFDSG